MNYYIFGAGNNAKTLFKEMRKHGCNVIGVVDNNAEKVRNSSGLIVESPRILLDVDKRKTCVAISPSAPDVVSEIVSQLVEMGFDKKNFFWAGDVFNLHKGEPHIVSGRLENYGEYESVKTYDKHSRLVISQKERKIYRIYNDENEKQKIEVLLSQLKAANLLGKYVVDSWIEEDLMNQKTCFAIGHKFIDPITYCFEWTPEMFSAYVLFMLELIVKLAEIDLCLGDAHNLNATISEGRFIFIDFGALKEGVMPRYSIVNFMNTHLIPLLLMLKDQSEIAYTYLQNPSNNYSVSDVHGYLSESEKESLNGLYHRGFTAYEHRDVIELMLDVKAFILNTENELENTIWTGYQNDEWEWDAYKEKWSTKMQNVAGLLDELAPTTVVDLAGNMGWYGSYGCAGRERSIVVDFDRNCVTDLWKRINNNNMNNVSAVYMSFCSPTNKYYKDYQFECQLL